MGSCSLERGIVMKKVLRWVPIVNIILFILMFVGMIKAGCYTEGAYSYCSNELWQSEPYMFSLADVMSLFGHSNGDHLLMNGLALLVYAVPAELLLGRRKFIASVVLAMVIQVIIGELTESSGLGASGWLMAMPGLMLGASMWRIRKEGEESDYMSIPSFLFGTSIILLIVDVVSLGGADGVDHLAHISGFVTGLIFVIAGLPFLAMTIRDEYRAYERQIMLHRKRQIEGSYLV
jgi:membrane associated rhomboid family serine protease